MSGFVKGAQEIMNDLNCSGCASGECRNCAAAQAYEEAEPIHDVEDYIPPIIPRCHCFSRAMTAHFQAYQGRDLSEPTKQREGDQPLPGGEGECVQDRIIAMMEESKRVGLERYGSVLKTFNGRRGIQDALEEVRDLLVYFTQLDMEADATEDTLLKVVDAVLVEADLEVPGCSLTRDAIGTVSEMIVAQLLSGLTIRSIKESA